MILKWTEFYGWTIKTDRISRSPVVRRRMCDSTWLIMRRLRSLRRRDPIRLHGTERFGRVATFDVCDALLLYTQLNKTV